jgi:uncharacterized membrane protein YeaQ/YmgE (transglycosylase-associated protein family)
MHLVLEQAMQFRERQTHCVGLLAAAGGAPGGFIVSVVLGLAGAFLGTWIARQLHLPTLLAVHIEGRAFPILWSIVGAMVLVAVASTIMRPMYRPRYR